MNQKFNFLVKREMKKLLVLFGIFPFLFASCTKSGALTGGSASSGSGSFGGSINGSVNGGLSNVSGATVGLYIAGNPNPIGSATTASNGAFSLAFTNPGGTSLLYLKVTGGNAGDGTNSNSQFLSVAGTTASLLSTLSVNEMTTAATEQVALGFGILQDTAGTVTLGAPSSASGLANVVTQFNNLISSGQLNTNNVNLTSGTQTGLNALANAFASCIENSSTCGTLFNTASSANNTAAASLLESGMNAIVNSSNVAGPLYTLAQPFGANTGFTLSSSTPPNGFTFANPLAVSIGIYAVAGVPLCIAFDSSGNAYIGSIGSNKISKFSPQGVVLQTINTGYIHGIAIDASGNIWDATDDGHLQKFNSAGTQIFSLATSPAMTHVNGVAIDASGNVWADNTANTGNMQEFNGSGTVLRTISGLTGPCCNNIAIDASGNIWLPRDRVTSTGIVSALSGSGATGVAIDPSGNAWINNSGSTINKYNAAGNVIGTYSAGSNIGGVTIDSDANVWVGNGSGVNELNSAGAMIAAYSPSGIAVGGYPQGLGVDPAGNLWMTGGTGNKIYFLPNVAAGPTYFPYSGPIWP